MALSPEWVTLRAEGRPGLTVRARLGDGSIVPSGGVGGFEAVARPGLAPLIAWRGPSDPFTLPIPLVLDGLTEGEAGRSVEPDIAKLEKMAGLWLRRGEPADQEPSLVIIDGDGGIPHDYTREPRNRWVIGGLEWGDSIRRTSDGRKVRQAVTVTFLLNVEDDVMKRLRYKRKRQPRYEYRRAKAGDTYEKLAARELKAKKLGGRLARLNGQRSPDVRLRRNARVRVPGPELLRRWKRGK